VAEVLTLLFLRARARRRMLRTCSYASHPGNTCEFAVARVRSTEESEGGGVGEGLQKRSASRLGSVSGVHRQRGTQSSNASDTQAHGTLRLREARSFEGNRVRERVGAAPRGACHWRSPGRKEPCEESGRRGSAAPPALSLLTRRCRRCHTCSAA